MLSSVKYVNSLKCLKVFNSAILIQKIIQVLVSVHFLLIILV